MRGQDTRAGDAVEPLGEAGEDEVLRSVAEMMATRRGSAGGDDVPPGTTF